ncbi:uncharacterized protein BDW43DRAFT_230380 [Aspergillus alliaceus]|uniref:uncharacterized protein n=1 Tax=Petromyces alliaceus TaxID=209559 RepID=UPI0012A41B3B|nr:uncharacterized protein BDW43DRAFT_230380 [Aspergillus alliaceus]KAB8237073.1 hypothetical protein BDW43DRAFT_230380 [Aspergillus alliaceus]
MFARMLTPWDRQDFRDQPLSLFQSFFFLFLVNPLFASQLFLTLLPPRFCWAVEACAILFPITYSKHVLPTICSPSRNEPITEPLPVAPLTSFCADPCRCFGYRVSFNNRKHLRTPFFIFPSWVQSAQPPADCRLSGLSWVAKLNSISISAPLLRLLSVISHIQAND